jgi:hypothetical protein
MVEVRLKDGITLLLSGRQRLDHPKPLEKSN